MTTALLIVAFFALVLWLVFRRNRKQTEQHDNSQMANRLTGTYSTTGLAIPPRPIHVSQIRPSTVQYTSTGLSDDTLDVLSQAAYLAALSQQGPVVVDTDDYQQQVDQPIFVPGGGDSGGAGASNSWDQPQQEVVVAAEPETTYEPEPETSSYEPDTSSYDSPDLS